jgi:hypothetical protein
MDAGAGPKPQPPATAATAPLTTETTTVLVRPPPQDGSGVFPARPCRGHANVLKVLCVAGLPWGLPRARVSPPNALPTPIPMNAKATGPETAPGLQCTPMGRDIQAMRSYFQALDRDESSDDSSEGERECCLLVLNLVSSTLPCIRQPRPRLRVLDSSEDTEEQCASQPREHPGERERAGER